MLTVCSYHVMYGFQSKSALYSCLNVKELFAWNRRDIWSLSDSNGIRTYNLLVRKQKLDHLAKLAKWLMCCEYLSLWCIWLYVIIMLSPTRFRVNLHSFSSIIWSVWPNGWVFVYELSGCGFESCCCHT